ncbi:MAG: hypothetical protein AB7G75_35605 [Candidatus Binatia bacterium]
MHSISTKRFRISCQPVEALRLLFVMSIFAASVAPVSAEEVKRQSLADWRKTESFTSNIASTRERSGEADTFVLRDNKRLADGWLQPSNDDSIVDEAITLSDQFTTAPSFGPAPPDSVACWSAPRYVCADNENNASPPTGSDFIDSMQIRYPDHHYKFSVNQTFSAGSYPYLQGTLTGATQYSIEILLTSKPSGVENGSIVAYLDVYRQPTLGGGYGWAEYYSVPLYYEEGPVSYCVCCNCPCGNGSYESWFRKHSCSEEGENFDYLFRISPADEDQGFSFHVGVAYLGYFQ